MEAYLGHALTVLVMLGGLAGVHARVMAKLATIETRMQVYDEGKADRAAARKGEAHQIARSEIREHEADCPGRETTGVRAMQ